MIKRLVSWVVVLACILLQAIPALASTSGTTVSGTVPLLIFDVQTSGITGHAATISWQTNGSASSQVFYDNKMSHDNTDDYAYHSNLDDTPVIQHSVLLDGLSPSTTYHCRVKSVATIDGEVFTAVSPDFTFKTLSSPCVMTICAFPVGADCAVLWGCLASRGSTSPVEVYFQYGTTDVYGSETPHQKVTCEPRVFVALVNNLLPNATYHFRAVAVGNDTSNGDDKVFRTLPQPVITVISPDGGENWARGSHQTITWAYANVSGYVKIELLRGGVLNRVIGYATTRGSSGTGSYYWAIPSAQTTGSDYKIRVTSISDIACSDTSNNNFTITKK